MFMNVHPIEMIHAPQQTRSRQALERMYIATSELLADRDFDQITVKDVAEEANVSVGSVYQRFATKDALLWSLYDRYLCESEDRVSELASKSDSWDLDQRISGLIKLTADLFSNWRGVIRSLHLRQQKDSTKIPGALVTRIEDVYRQLIQILEPGTSNTSYRINAKFAVSLILSACRERFLYYETQSDVLGFRTNKLKFMSSLKHAALGVFPVRIA